MSGSYDLFRKSVCQRKVCVSLWVIPCVQLDDTLKVGGNFIWNTMQTGSMGGPWAQLHPLHKEAQTMKSDVVNQLPQ